MIKTGSLSKIARFNQIKKLMGIHRKSRSLISQSSRSSLNHNHQLQKQQLYDTISRRESIRENLIFSETKLRKRFLSNQEIVVEPIKNINKNKSCDNLQYLQQGDTGLTSMLSISNLKVNPSMLHLRISKEKTQSDFLSIEEKTFNQLDQLEMEDNKSSLQQQKLFFSNDFLFNQNLNEELSQSYQEDEDDENDNYFPVIHTERAGYSKQNFIQRQFQEIPLQNQIMGDEKIQKFMYQQKQRTKFFTKVKKLRQEINQLLTKKQQAKPPPQNKEINQLKFQKDQLQQDLLQEENKKLKKSKFSKTSIDRDTQENSPQIPNLIQKINDLEREIENLRKFKEKYNDMEDIESKFREENQAIVQQITEKNFEIDKLRDEVYILNQEGDELRYHLKELLNLTEQQEHQEKEVSEEFKQQLEQAQQLCQQWDQERQQLINQIELFQSDPQYKFLEEEITNLQNNLNYEQEVNEELSNQCQIAQKRLEEIDQQNNNLIAEIIKTKEQEQSDIENKIQILQDQIREFGIQTQKYEEQIRLMERAIQQEQESKKIELFEYVQENKNLNEKLVNQSNIIITLSEDKANLIKEINLVQDFMESQYLKNSNKQNLQISTQRKSNKEKKQTKIQTNQEQALCQSINVLEKELDQMSDQLKEKQKNEYETVLLKGEISRLQAIELIKDEELQMANQVIINLKSELEKIEESKQVVQQKQHENIQKLENENQHLQQAITRLKFEINKLQKQLEENENRQKQFQLQIFAKQEAIDQKEQQIEKLMTQNSQLTEEIQSLVVKKNNNFQTQEDSLINNKIDTNFNFISHKNKYQDNQTQTSTNHQLIKSSVQIEEKNLFPEIILNLVAEVFLLMIFLAYSQQKANLIFLVALLFLLGFTYLKKFSLKLDQLFQKFNTHKKALQNLLFGNFILTLFFEREICFYAILYSLIGQPTSYFFNFNIQSMSIQKGKKILGTLLTAFMCGISQLIFNKSLIHNISFNILNKFTSLKLFLIGASVGGLAEYFPGFNNLNNHFTIQAYTALIFKAILPHLE